MPTQIYSFRQFKLFLHSYECHGLIVTIALLFPHMYPKMHEVKGFILFSSLWLHYHKYIAIFMIVHVLFNYTI